MEIACNIMLSQVVLAIMINAIDVGRGQALLTGTQKMFQASVFHIVRAKQDFVRHEQNGGVIWLQQIVSHRYFEVVTMSVIILNVIVLLLESPDAPLSHQAVLHIVEQVFVCFYVVEQVIKITAFSWAYFVPKINGSRVVSLTNTFDFVVSLISFLQIYP